MSNGLVGDGLTREQRAEFAGSNILNGAQMAEVQKHLHSLVTDQVLRKWCVELAANTRGTVQGATVEQVLEIAERSYAFITAAFRADTRQNQSNQ